MAVEICSKCGKCTALPAGIFRDDSAPKTTCRICGGTGKGVLCSCNKPGAVDLCGLCMDGYAGCSMCEGTGLAVPEVKCDRVHGGKVGGFLEPTADTLERR